MMTTTGRALSNCLAIAFASLPFGCGGNGPPATCSDRFDDACDQADVTDAETIDASDSETTPDTADVGVERDVAPDGLEPDIEPDTPESDVQDDPDADVVYPPLEASVSPENGAMYVPLDVVISVAFNQPMNALRFIPSNVSLKEFDGEEVPRTIAYDGDTMSLELSPEPSDSLLRPATPYEFRLNDVIASVSGEELGEDLIAEFSTTGYPGRGFHRTLAEAYAPVVYQQVEEPTIDTFTRIDFDGDLSPANNLESTVGAAYGFAYYDVAETVTHFFLTYLYYYPGSHPRAGVTYEHDVVMAQLVVHKDGESPLGRLRAFSTFYHENLNVWLLDSSLYADGDEVRQGEEGLDGRLNAEWIENGRNPSIFIESGRHGVCLPNVSTPLGPCAPTSGGTAPFEDDTTGLVYRVAEEALRYGDVADDELTYSLRNFVEEFWALRNRTSGDAAVFGGGYNYRPPPISDEANRPGEGETFPTALNSDHAEGSFGDLPFIYNATGNREDQGVWFADPAWGVLDLFEFSESFSIEYCFNPYLNIDLRDLRDGCTPTDFVLEEQ